MKRLVFITGEDLLDVDLPIVKEIHKKYNFTWVIILRGYGWFKEDKLRDICNQNGINVVIKHQNFKLKSPKTIFFHFKVLYLLRSLKADLIYDSYLGVPYMHLFTSYFINQNRFVIAIHDVVQHYKMSNRAMRSFYYNFLMKRYDNIHLFSDNQFKIFTSMYTGKNILLAPLCLKDFGKSIVDGNKILIDNKTNFLFFGIIRENKGVDLLIQAVNLLSEKYNNFTVTIAGKSDGDCWERNKILIKDESKFKTIIRILGSDEIPDLLSSADFMILPYRDATQSGVLLTSYNYGLPVIASDLSGFNEYVKDGENGFLFANGNIESLAEKMEKAINMNREEYTEVKANLERFVEMEISVKAISQKYIKYIDSILYK